MPYCYFIHLILWVYSWIREQYVTSYFVLSPVKFILNQDNNCWSLPCFHFVLTITICPYLLTFLTPVANDKIWSDVPYLIE